MIKKIGIAGAGTMGASIAQTFALFNYDVVVFDIYESALDKAKRLVEINQETWIKSGIVSIDQSTELKNRIKYSNDIQSFKEVDFLIEGKGSRSCDFKKGLRIFP